MQRQSISKAEFTLIESQTVISQMHSGVMTVSLGKHQDFGRVILLRSGTSFVIIADELEALQDGFSREKLIKAITRKVAPPQIGSDG